nr:hypothetical protein [Tanacetum cinerariifolium]
MTAGQRKLEEQWTGDERKAANLDHRLKSLIMSDFQDSTDDEEDTRSSHEYPNDLEEEYQARALLAKSKRFFKNGTQSSSQHKPELRPTDDFEAKYNKVKAKVALLSLSALASKAATAKNKGAKNGEWVKISMRKCDIRKPIWYLDSGCSRHLTGVKSYLYKYMEQPRPKVVFGDDSTCITEGYGSIKCNVDNINIAENERYLHDEYLYPYEPSQRVEGTSVQDTIPIPNSSLSIPSMVSSAPQDRWSQEKHIELVNIIRNPGARMLTRSMAKELSAASAHECLFVDFLSKEEPKKTPMVLHNKLGHDLNGKAVMRLNIKVPKRYSQSWSVVSKVFKFDLKGYLDSDYDGCNMDMKSTSNACYCCWMLCQHIMNEESTDQDIIYEKVPIFYDNTSAIAISNNPVRYSRTKHIDIRYHSIRDHILKEDIELHFIPTQYQLADIFTKPLDEPTFKRLIVELGGKIGGLDQISNKDATILYCLANGVKVDYAKLIWEDIIHKLNKKIRGKVIPYPRFISLLLEYMMPEYDNEKLTINHTQVFSVHNWALKPNQTEGPPFTNHMKAICNLDVHVDFKAPKPSSQTKESSLAKDKSPSHPLPPTLVVGEMHKEAQQAPCGPTSLGAISEEGSYPQLSSGINKESRADEISKKIKLNDLSDLLKDTRSAFFTSDSSQDEPIIISNESEKEEVEKDDTHATSHDVPEDTLIPHLPSPKSAQIQELMAKEKLKTLDSLVSLLNKVTDTLNRFATMVENASGTARNTVPLAGQASASPAEGEKNTTKDAETNSRNKLVDLLGINMVEQYHNKKLIFDKYCDKMLKRRKSSKIINCDVLAQKGHISLKVYREDGTIEVIANFKVSDLHLGE